ncbi:hypothetical protein PIB30_051443 [Stylosanthes scabra]|uniref:Uncharacterized protein n=1 Tax=Stylosanthes scabra TaxID=79078 RepID=A0ABU6RHY4_9FABA|nr:hypothetical protein [Stylosanthes scabra]
MCRNSEIADLKATSSKGLIDKLRIFESNRQKLAKEPENYGMQEVSSPNKEADLPRLGAAQDKGKGYLETTRKKKGVSRISNRNKTMPTILDEQHCTATQQPESNHVPQGEPSAQGWNNSAFIERDKTDGLKRKLDAIRKWSNTVPTTNVTHELSSANSAHITGNLGQ